MRRKYHVTRIKGLHALMTSSGGVRFGGAIINTQMPFRIFRYRRYSVFNWLPFRINDILVGNWHFKPILFFQGRAVSIISFRTSHCDSACKWPFPQCWGVDTAMPKLDAQSTSKWRQLSRIWMQMIRFRAGRSFWMIGITARLSLSGWRI